MFRFDVPDRSVIHRPELRLVGITKDSVHSDIRYDCAHSFSADHGNNTSESTSGDSTTELPVWGYQLGPGASTSRRVERRSHSRIRYNLAARSIVGVCG